MDEKTKETMDTINYNLTGSHTQFEIVMTESNDCAWF